MYYLTYRPKNVGEIDNSHVRETITQLLATKSFPHALLLIGQKGTGKTSIARIMAKAINGVNEDDSVDHPDIVEMDAASNRGIEEIKNVIKEASYMPMSGAYRIFIIDEAHMITNEGFNALLKTLEEPPPSALFILATTNVEKVPKTIASRCFVINFGRAKKLDVVHMLKRICEKEKIKTTDDVLDLIAQYCDYSFRDAAKILEQLVIQKKLDLESAREYLGVHGQKSLLSVLSSSTLAESMQWVQSFVEKGGNVKNILENVLEDLRIQLLISSGVTVDEDVQKLSFTTVEITKLIKIVSDAYAMLKISPIESLPLEIAVAEFYNYKKTMK